MRWRGRPEDRLEAASGSLPGPDRHVQELTRFLSGMLFGVSSLDPVTFAAMAGMLILVTLLACYIPARRASKVDPLTALRYE